MSPTKSMLLIENYSCGRIHYNKESKHLSLYGLFFMSIMTETIDVYAFHANNHSTILALE